MCHFTDSELTALLIMASFDEESALPEPLSKLETTELCGGFVTKFKEFQRKVKDADEKLGRRARRCLFLHQLRTE